MNKQLTSPGDIVTFTNPDGHLLKAWVKLPAPQVLTDEPGFVGYLVRDGQPQTDAPIWGYDRCIRTINGAPVEDGALV